MASDLTTIRRRADALMADYQHARRSVEEETRRLGDARRALECAEEAQAAVQEVAQAVQEQVHQKIAAVVSRCLKAVFGEDAYEFRIDFEKKRGKTEANLLFVRDGEEVDPATASGGGAVDVASFALRVACLMLHRPRLRRLIVADEPFHWVNGKKYQERVAGMILSLAADMGVQFLIVTDDDWLMKAGKVVNVEEYER